MISRRNIICKMIPSKERSVWLLFLTLSLTGLLFWSPAQPHGAWPGTTLDMRDSLEQTLRSVVEQSASNATGASWVERAGWLRVFAKGLRVRGVSVHPTGIYVY